MERGQGEIFEDAARAAQLVVAYAAVQHNRVGGDGEREAGVEVDEDGADADELAQRAQPDIYPAGKGKRAEEQPAFGAVVVDDALGGLAGLFDERLKGPRHLFEAGKDEEAENERQRQDDERQKERRLKAGVDHRPAQVPEQGNGIGPEIPRSSARRYRRRAAWLRSWYLLFFRIALIFPRGAAGEQPPHRQGGKERGDE